MADRILATTPYLRLIDRDGWSFVDRPNASGVVVIVAVTGEGKLILVEQPRPPLGKMVIELPAGLAGDLAGRDGEALAEAARRELVEETGYEAESMELIATCATSPGMTNEMVSFFRARGLRHVSAGGGVEGEAITVHEVPLAGAEDWLRAREREGLAISVKVFAGLFWAARP